jgi:hypothetical protein
VIDQKKAERASPAATTHQLILNGNNDYKDIKTQWEL